MHEKNVQQNFWGYRIDSSYIKFFKEELHNGRLRQGWGWDVKQDLRNFKLDQGAGRNKPMFNRVKKGDIILVPRMPNWGDIALVEATEDWNKGYDFKVDEKSGDYGHIFPAKYLKSFTRHNENVTGSLRSTLKNPSRFWNINHYSEDIERLLNTAETELSKRQDYESRLENTINNTLNEFFNESAFATSLYNALTKQFTNEEWEFALEHGLKKLFPFYKIERVGGKSEVNHGTDILIKLPGIIPGSNYIIAIQVKDYEGWVSTNVIDQINKSANYWDNDNDNDKLIDRIVIITKADKDINPSLSEKDENVRFIFANDLKHILAEIGKRFKGL